MDMYKFDHSPAAGEPTVVSITPDGSGMLAALFSNGTVFDYKATDPWGRKALILMAH